ncbi:AI-2E family transporter [Flavimobilis marinus]|uniref:Predicted PurR-regulated permease PerM n=1 Tax=Flavimobilis marinus TaxID=285351 RepID=A0A1I2F9U0_9MICO|nr:AI-2E family transporter [Flavimobilis marinus]GHG52712.1 AI-2E family transporter [Flavimobilis marinus]SFF01518.1 Predicted PurR-regulated permease PerM [Flavimobilis marinus]
MPPWKKKKRSSGRSGAAAATPASTSAAPVLARAPQPPRRPSIWDDGLGRAAIRSAQVILVVVVAVAVVYVLIQLKLLVIPILIATVIAAAVSPLVAFLRRKGWPAALATWAAMLTGIGTISAVLWLVGRGIRNEWSSLVEEAGRGLDELQTYLAEGPLGLDDAQITAARESLTDLLASEQVQSGAIAGATAAIEAVTGIILGIVVLFFLIKDGKKIYGFLINPLDPQSRMRAERIGDRSVEVLGGYLRGTAIVALVDAVLIGAALAFLGVPLALPLATLVFLGAFIPLIGATLSGVFAALVALVANGPGVALIVVAVVIAVNQIEGDLLAPVVLGKALSLHPLAILMALTAGTILSGIIGALLAVPIAAVSWAAIKEWSATSDLDPGELTASGG